MLSAHEISTLLVLKNNDMAPADSGRIEVAVLVRRGLARFALDRSGAVLTDEGRRLVDLLYGARSAPGFARRCALD